MKLKICLFLCLLAAQGFSYAQDQEEWDLEACIRYAMDNSIAVKQKVLSVQNAKVDLAQSQHNRYPDLNATANIGNSYGRTIDPTTNSFRNTNLGFNSFGLNTSMTLFSGGRIHNQVRQNALNVKAGQYDVEETANNIALQVAQAYINVLFGEENLLNARNNLALSRNQLDQLDKFIQAGVRPRNDKLEAEAQVAQNLQAIVAAENSIQIAYLNLRQLMVLDDKQQFKVKKPSVEIPTDANPERTAIDEVYGQALKIQPQIKAADVRLQSVRIGERIARAGYLPALGFSAGLNTNYSSVNSLFSQGPVQYSEPQLVKIGDDEIPVQFPIATTVVSKYPYFDQLSDNLGFNVGLGLQVPIFNNRQNKSAVQRAQIATLNTEYANELVRQNLRSSVAQAVTEARAAQKTLEASMLSLNAQDASLKDQTKRFEAGSGNLFDLNAARSRFELAQQNLTIAKYDYLFKLKVVDFYQGKTLDLK